MNRSVPMRWQALHLAKGGNKPEEYEDAFAVNAEAGRFAVADGASESSFAGLWARLLAEGFVKPNAKPDPGSNWLAPLQERWAAEVDGKPLPWYAEAKRTQGAFATFCGLVLRHTGAGPEEEWRGLAVGDSCLVQVRNDALLKAFPLEHSKEFGNEPLLLGSRSDAAIQLRDRHRKFHGHWQTGDRFFLMTDALAQWFLGAIEAGEKPWEAIRDLAGGASIEEAFADWIGQLRKGDVLRNDDVTLIALEV